MCHMESLRVIWMESHPSAAEEHSLSFICFGFYQCLWKVCRNELSWIKYVFRFLRICGYRDIKANVTDPSFFPLSVSAITHTHS